VDGERGKRLRPFLLGGIVGSLAGIAAAGKMKVGSRAQKRRTPAGLAAFEQAPCFEELVEREGRGKRPGQVS
jgi:hypothetical protein